MTQEEFEDRLMALETAAMEAGLTPDAIASSYELRRMALEEE